MQLNSPPPTVTAEADRGRRLAPPDQTLFAPGVVKKRESHGLPKVSILIPCYNAEPWIEQAIRSALEQTWPNKEVIIVDDGSTDGSLDVIRSFGDCVRFETGPNRGGNVARNHLLELAGGEWLQYLDADDYLLPEKIERQIGEVQNHAAVDVAFSPVIIETWSANRLVAHETQRIPGEPLPWVRLIRWELPQTGAALCRRSAILDVGGWKPDQRCCQEHELYFRLLAADKSFQFCPTPGAVYRIWSTNTVCRRNPLETITRRLAIIDAAERRLDEIGLLNDMRRDAIALTRLECARSLYQLDRAEALRVAAMARRIHPALKLSPVACFPRAYRWMFRAAGFHAAEMAARLIRPWRSKRTA